MQTSNKTVKLAKNRNRMNYHQKREAEASQGQRGKKWDRTNKRELWG